MKILILVLITTRIAIGQINPSASLDFKPGDLVNQYVVFGDLKKGSAIGENIDLKKNGKFNYSVFAIGDGVGYADKSMAKGRYKINGDTVRITIKHKSYSSETSDVFDLSSYYLVRTITQRETEDKGQRKLTCLVPGDKVGTWEAVVNSYLTASVDKVPEGQFWKESIFTSQNQ